MDVVTVSSLVEKAARDVNDADLDPVAVTIFGSICEAMRAICKVQDRLATAVLKSNSADSVPFTPVVRHNRQQSNMVSLGAIPKRHRGQISLSQPASSTGTAIGSEFQIVAGAGTGTGTGTGSITGTDTVPVKYEFKDRETKFAAEKILKATCGINCSTPYLTLVRECIRQIVEEVKKDYPDNFIRVTLDTNNMVFKVARRPPKDAPDNGWKYGKVDVPIPESALDINCRRVPKGYKIAIPDLSPKKVGRTDSSSSSISSIEMETAGLNEV
jgi:hypothetical protein